MKKVLFILLFCFVCSVAFGAADWSILNEQFNDIDDWTSFGAGTGSAVQETFDSKETCKEYTGASGGSYGGITADIGSITTNYTVEFKVYLDAWGASATNDQFYLDISNTETKALRINLGSDGFIISGSSGATEIGTDILSEDTWYVIRILVTGGTSCDVYIDDSLEGDDIDCNISAGATPDGVVTSYQLGFVTANRISYMDYIQIDDGLQTPSTTGFAGKVCGVSSPAKGNSVTPYKVSGVE